MNDKRTQKLLKLPIGIQTFEKLREDGYVYVDKTKYLIDMIDNGTVYFLSRPRRFGKSLTVSTFDALFSGKKELFKGLYAEEFLNRPEYRTHPVIHIDMSKLITDEDLDMMRKSLLRQIKQNAAKYGINTEYENPTNAFGDIIYLLSEKHGRVVILIDEYDKPILDCLDDTDKANKVRAVLRGFYTQIKGEDSNIKFVFMTGITKFTKAGVFSALNNLKDISINDDYAAMLGYTQEELEYYFDGYIDETASHLDITKEELLSQIQSYYDGFSFDGKTRLYNPFSTLNFFADKTFKNYWFESGSPSFLVNYAKTHDLDAEEMRGKIEDEDFLTMTEIELAKPSSFLFQAGYLTIRKKEGSLLTLDYPNKEVLSSMAAILMYKNLNNPDTAVIMSELDKALSNNDTEYFVTLYNKTLAAIPYDIYDKEERKYEDEKRKRLLSYNLAESFYHSIMFTMLWTAGVTTLSENHSYRGRSDIEILHKNNVFIIELKVAEGAEKSKQAAEEGMKQIIAKGYCDKYQNPKLISIAVDKTQRQIGAYKIGD